MTVSNKRLLNFFPGVECVSVCSNERGGGSVPVRPTPARGGAADSESLYTRPQSLVGLVVRAARRRVYSARPGTTTPSGLCSRPRAVASELHGGAPGLRRRPPLAPAAPRGWRRVRPAGGEERGDMRGPVGAAAAERGLGSRTPRDPLWEGAVHVSRSPCPSLSFRGALPASRGEATAGRRRPPQSGVWTAGASGRGGRVPGAWRGGDGGC